MKNFLPVILLFFVNNLFSQSLEEHYEFILTERMIRDVKQEFKLEYIEFEDFFRKDTIAVLDEWGNFDTVKILYSLDGELYEGYYHIDLVRSDTSHDSWLWLGTPVDFDLLYDLLKEDIFNAKYFYDITGGLYGMGALNFSTFTIRKGFHYFPEKRYWLFLLEFYFK